MVKLLQYSLQCPKYRNLPNTSCALNIIRYSDSPPRMDQLSLYNHGNPFSTSPAIACSLILPRVPTLEIYSFKMSLLMKSAIIESCQIAGKLLSSNEGVCWSATDHSCSKQASSRTESTK